MSEQAESRRVESVSAFTRRVKTLLETGVGRAWVRGEVSNLRLQSSGHSYFSIKDAGAQLSCVLFRGDASRRDGAQVLVFGDISVYEARGQYQLIVRAVVDDGEGRLQQEFEALKRRLAAEGLFDQERKRALPTLPWRVGIVTSPTGAALQDFIRIMMRRGWRGHLIVLPAKVQGEGAAAEIAAMINRVDASGDQLGGRLDALVVGRGGGSLEDLWAFNEEVVVRAIAACPVPVISAVGHEIDFSLSDFAADVRAETPSGAAELLSTRFHEVIDRWDDARERLLAGVEDRMTDHRERLDALRSRLRLMEPRRQIEQGWLRRDDLASRLQVALRGAWREKQTALQTTRAALLARSPERKIEVASHQLLGLWKRLQSASPDSVLQRGFVIMRDAQGRPVARREGLAAGDRLSAEFRDGGVDVEVR